MSVKGNVNVLRTEQNPARNLRINRFGNQYSTAKILNNKLGRMETSLWVLYSQNIILSNDRMSQAEWKYLCCLLFCGKSTDLWWTCQLMFTTPCCITCESGVHSAVLAFHITHVNLTGCRCLILSKPFNSWTWRSWASFSQCIRSLFTQMSIDVSNVLKHAGRHLCKRWAWLHCRRCALQLVQLGEKKKQWNQVFL